MLDIKAALAKCKRVDGRGWHRSSEPFQERAGTTFALAGAGVERVKLSAAFDSAGQASHCDSLKCAAQTVLSSPLLRTNIP